ncbi:hypothetical protein N9901_02065 [Flavobacteriaceae bacterium]|nr:hypothetical protein [Flavobacteriaceae bacterium]
MSKFNKTISLLLHPVFLPLVGCLVYLAYLPIELSLVQKKLVLFIVAGTTLVIPIVTLLIFRVIGYIKTLQAETIEERKMPVLLMMVNYLFLGQVLKDLWQLRELSVLAYATAVGLVITWLLFKKGIKASLHMQGIMGLLGFLLVYGFKYGFNVKGIVALILVAALLAKARLELKAHTMNEVVIGSLMGVGFPVVLNLFL